MKISPQWIREFVSIPADNRELAEALTNAGAAVEGIAGEGDAMVFEMEITTNRPDQMNHFGLAREASAIYNLPLPPLSAASMPPGASSQPAQISAEGSTQPFLIQVDDAEGCARYTAQVIRGVTIKPSPELVARRLLSVDQRPINNAADASNYTLWEMGHPTHAFDLDLLEGSKIIVRRARDGETLKTLDGVDRRLSSQDLVIADARKPVALAGVMGGFDTMITEKTRNVLIESAWFDPGTVRSMSKRHGLHTDASHRFERGADYGATPLACARVSQCLMESAGGRLEGGPIDAIARGLDRPGIALSLREVERILGPGVDRADVARILVALGFSLTSGGSGSADRSSHAGNVTGSQHFLAGDFLVQPPSWRLDVEREIDLIEELARIKGYDKFPNTLPAYSGEVVELPDAEKDRRLRDRLLALGYNETVSLSFISREDAARFAPTAEVLELANPLSTEASIMRTSIVPSLLDMLSHNLNRGQNDVRLFEAGAVLLNSTTGPAEPKRICLAATAYGVWKQAPQGSALDMSKGDDARSLEVFRSLKGDIEQLLSAFACDAVEYDSESAGYYDPGRSARARMDGATVAQFGYLHPDAAASRKLKQGVVIAEIYLDSLYRYDLRTTRYEPVPRYPGVERDFSFLFPDGTDFSSIQNAVAALGIQELRAFVPVEIFRGGSVPPGGYSVLLRATFQSRERTLREEEVAVWSAQVVSGLQQLGGEQRA